MNKMIVAALASLVAVNVALAETPSTTPAPAASDTCEAKAISKAGKPLAGAAKAAFMKKCEKEGKTEESKTDEAKTGKAPQQEKMKTCNKEATGKKGDERKQFMSECLKK